ncbi:MAG: ABC transporter ATP-binding protein [Rhodomicrobium sp.]
MALLETKHLSVNFGGIAAVADVLLAVEAGEIHGVIGPNGAGKTTLINAITGVVAAQTGRISFDGADITGLAPDAIASHGLGRTFQHCELFGDCTVIENVLTGFYRRQPYGVVAAALGIGKARRMEKEARQGLHHMLADFGLADFADVRAQDLPFGLQKRIDMARALAANPKLLLLDEPVSGMSEAEANGAVTTIKEIARERGITVLIVEHNMRVLMSLATRVTVLNQGRVLATGRPDEVRSNSAVIEAYLGEDA